MRRIAAAMLFQAALLLGQGGTAGIQGTVADAGNKKPVAGAFVTAIRAGLPPYSQTATTAADGGFQIGSLAAGAYSLCIQVSGGEYLDPCQWSGTPFKLTLAAGQQSTGNALKISSGSVLQVRVDDPVQLLGKKTKDGRVPHLLVGVWTPNGLFYPLHAGSKDNAGASLQLTVPRDMALKLQVASGDLKFAGANGAAINAPAGDQQSFQHASSDSNPKSFKYTITGVVP